MTLYFITGNKNKFEEAREFFPKIKQLDIDLPEIQETDSKEIIKEKLLEAMKHKKGEFIVDDVGLHMESLNGLPGPLIKWFLQKLELEGLYQLAKKVGNKCEVVIHIGYAKNEDEIYYFDASITGKIVKPRGNSWGWNNVFLPDGYDKTFGEMSLNEKRKISMRTIALKKFKEFYSK